MFSSNRNLIQFLFFKYKALSRINVIGCVIQVSVVRRRKSAERKLTEARRLRIVAHRVNIPSKTTLF